MKPKDVFRLISIADELSVLFQSSIDGDLAEIEETYLRERMKSLRQEFETLQEELTRKTELDYLRKKI